MERSADVTRDSDRPPTESGFGVGLRAGIALYNAGEYHAAHDPWEAEWLPLEGGDDERFLQGLIQFTAAVHHADRGNDSGATGLAESAAGYLEGLPEVTHGVALDAVREFLDRLAEDPGVVRGRSPPPLVYKGRPLDPADLDPPAAFEAAEAIAEEVDGFDGGIVADAVRYAREERHTGRTRFTALVYDLVGDPSHRPVAYRRLADLVERRRARDDDVDALFEG